MTDSDNYIIKRPPNIVGYWVLSGSVPGGETMFAMTGKPSWLRRKAMWLVLGFKWRDA